MRILTVVGARPQFIKHSVMSKAIHQLHGTSECVVHTGQHYDSNMSDVFFDEMGIHAPDYNLAAGSGGHGAQTGRMLERLEPIIEQEKPDWVVVYGDTNSTLAGALVSTKLHIPVAHVEAGLRSFNRKMPEEINRILTDHASDLLFAPTQAAMDQLLKEGIPQERIHLVGDIMYDAALFYGEAAEAQSDILRILGVGRGAYILATIHRAENTGDANRLKAIFTALEHLAQDLPVVLPLHPRTKQIAKDLGFELNGSSGLAIVDPLGYFDMVKLEQNARLILTDSGGVQKEAFFYKVPCVTVRFETEWTELLDLGWNHLAPPISSEAILEVVKRVLANPSGRAGQPYGDGRTAEKILNVLLRGNA